ncbi:tetratricopeptide repeat protein [Halovulum dunhuangense]|uniref:Tetratricopeptide repeat protein n=1 Tax=Halovulum dunhuangense TaxID=1505036 RepID=A0A849L4W8_9RHOB|nr:tetratricopeptide repeat protein [Halovulum dunhuangense]NNU81399.1 tetratricopeptide repeat protein [Halovulum dunhuangense]
MKNPVAVLSLAVLLAAGPGLSQSLSDRAELEAEAERLLAELSDPELRTAQATENRLIGVWSRSGSETVDFLLSRARTLIEEEEYLTALDHLTALTDHAPDFAEGWYVRATTFYRLEEFGLAMRDLERALALNPQHFGALMGLGTLLEEMGHDALAVRALRLAQDLNPHQPDIAEAIARLEYRLGEASL